MKQGDSCKLCNAGTMIYVLVVYPVKMKLFRCDNTECEAEVLPPRK